MWVNQLDMFEIISNYFPNRNVSDVMYSIKRRCGKFVFASIVHQRILCFDVDLLNGFVICIWSRKGTNLFKNLS